MNIWILNHYALPPQRAGGTRHFDLAKRWVKAGHQVTILASGFDYMMRTANIPRDLWYKEQLIEGVRFVWVKARPYDRNNVFRLLNMLDYSVNAYKYASRLPRPDIVIGSIVHHFAALSAWRLAIRHQASFVLEVRDVWPDTLVDMGSFSDGHPFVLLLEGINRVLLPRADHIVCVPPFASERLVRSGAKRDNITVIPNFVDLERFSVANELPIAKNTFTLMYVGLHGKSNGLGVLLRAARIIQDQLGSGKISFRLIGDGPEKPVLIELAKTLELRNVTFESPVPKEEVVKKMSQADAFIFHLQDIPVLFKHGISPNKLLDYMAMGRPVVFACNSKNNPVEEAGAGLTIPPQNAEAMAQAVLELAKQPFPMRKQMGEAGRKYVEKFHNADVAAGRLLDIFERLQRLRTNGT